MPNAFKVSKSSLAILLSKLSSFNDPKPGQEQYQTESEIAAEIAWSAFMQGDIKDRAVADYGCGNGILGIAALLLGARKAIFVDSDPEAIKLTKRNIKTAEAESGIGLLRKATLICCDIEETAVEVDTVLQNPPFGVQREHADKPFLLAAFRNAAVVYSFHKPESKGFIGKLSAEHGFSTTHYLEFDFLLRNTMNHHTRPRARIRVGLWRIKKV